MEVNHEEEVVDTERFDLSREMEDVTLDNMQPAEQEVAKRLTTSIVNTYLDTKDIAFERYTSMYILTYLDATFKCPWQVDMSVIFTFFYIHFRCFYN